MGLLNWIFGSSNDSVASVDPSVNIDGSPMCGSFDINGNPFGVSEISDSSSPIMDDSFSSMMDDSSCGFDDSFSSFDDSSCGSFDDW
ncbi:MAG: hypothetical protein ACI9EK_001318 [Psychroserpens sp.]|jgi:hypothetical protein